MLFLLVQRAVQRKLQRDLRERGAVHFDERGQELGEQGGVYGKTGFRKILQKRKVVPAELALELFFKFWRKAQQQDRTHFGNREEREHLRLRAAACRFMKHIERGFYIFFRKRL